jgi:hypothetical protein
MGFLSHNGGETYNTCHCKSRSISHPYMLIRQMCLTLCSLEQFWNCRYEFLARSCIHCILWLPRFYRRILLWGSCFAVLLSHILSSYRSRLFRKRWGDAPVHSIAVGLFARKDQIHFFEEIGYQHDDWSHCPLDDGMWESGRCACNQRNSFGKISFFSLSSEILGTWADAVLHSADYDGSSCKRQWDYIMKWCECVAYRFMY